MPSTTQRRASLGLGANLNRAVIEARKALEVLLDDEMGRFGLSLGEADVLTVVLTAGTYAPAPTELADWLRLTTAGITGRLDSLQRKDLIERRPHVEDGRRLTIHLTRDGRKRARAVLAAKDATLRSKVVDEIGEDQAASIVERLDRVADAARGA